MKTLSNLAMLLLLIGVTTGCNTHVSSIIISPKSSSLDVKERETAGYTVPGYDLYSFNKIVDEWAKENELEKVKTGRVRSSDGFTKYYKENGSLTSLRKPMEVMVSVYFGLPYRMSVSILESSNRPVQSKRVMDMQNELITRLEAEFGDESVLTSAEIRAENESKTEIGS